MSAKNTCCTADQECCWQGIILGKSLCVVDMRNCEIFLEVVLRIADHRNGSIFTGVRNLTVICGGRLLGLLDHLELLFRIFHDQHSLRRLLACDDRASDHRRQSTVRKNLRCIPFQNKQGPLRNNLDTHESISLLSK